MKRIDKYIAEDNTEFDKEDDCVEYERQCAMIDAIIGRMPERAKGCDFSNGSGYIQHDAENVSQIKVNLLEFANETFSHEWFQQSIDDPNIHPSWVGRLICDMGHRHLNLAWNRFLCIDENGREWGQPYYASHPHEAKQVKLN